MGASRGTRLIPAGCARNQARRQRAAGADPNPENRGFWRQRPLAGARRYRCSGRYRAAAGTRTLRIFATRERTLSKRACRIPLATALRHAVRALRPGKSARRMSHPRPCSRITSTVLPINSGRTVRSGAKVKISERSASAASRNAASHVASRSRTKDALPNGKTAATASTTR